MFLQFYGLEKQPFGVTPDPRFLYMGSAHQEALASLVYGIEMGRGFMALIASPGLGKTTILLRLMERLRESARTAFLFQTYSNSGEFLRGLLADLEIETSSQDLGELQKKLGDALFQEARSGKRIVVAIDEAQNLDDKVLEMVRMISNFETPESKLLQIVLVGQPQLADKLASPGLEQLRQRVSIIAHVPPFDAKEVPKYIDHRLRTAGYRGGELFTPAALRVIATHSKGIPRDINNLCFQALSLGYAKKQKQIDEATLREVVGDLNLKSLGTSPPAEPEKAPPAEPEKTPPAIGIGIAKDARLPREEVRLDVKPPSSPDSGGPLPKEHDGASRLDAVNLSSHLPIEDANPTFAAPSAPLGSILAGYEPKQAVRPVLWFALAALIAFLCAGAWLVKSGLEPVEITARGGRMSPEHHETDASPAPLADRANLPGGPTDPLEKPSTLTKDYFRTESNPEIPARAAAEATSAAGRGANSAVRALDLDSDSSRKSSSPSAPVNETSSKIGEAYAPGSGRLIVESSATGARVTLNGKSNPKWITPRLFSLASGTYVVSVSKGASPAWTRHVHVDEGQEKLIMAEIEDQERGLFTVDTDPPGMLVFIDGKPFGQSRVDAVLRPGWHECKVVPAPGREPLVRRFHLRPGEALTRRIRLGSPAASSRSDPPHPGG